MSGLSNGSIDNTIGRIFEYKDLAINVPYLQLADQKNDHAFYFMFTGVSRFPFRVGLEGNSDSGEGMYARIKTSGVRFSRDKTTAAYIDTDGTRYLFTQLKGNFNYLYHCTDIISSDGLKISFDYYNDGSYAQNKLQTIKNNKEETIVSLYYSPNETKVVYKDGLGREQLHKITLVDSNTVAEINALGLMTAYVYNDDGNITTITTPTGDQTYLEYDTFNTVNYVIDDHTSQIKYNSSYVTKMTKQPKNTAFAKTEVIFKPSQNGNNFAGNNVTCNKETMDNLVDVQDWLMECGLQRINGNDYTYTNDISFNLNIFSENTSYQKETITNHQAFNFLHLPVSNISQDSTGQFLTYELRKYSFSDTVEAKTFDQLTSYYDQPIQTSSRLYKTNSISEYKGYQSINKYFSKDDQSQAGFVLGQKKYSVTPSGVSSFIEYYPNSEKNNYQTLLKSVLTKTENGNQRIVNYSEPQWMSKTVAGNTLAIPYYTNVDIKVNEKLIKSTQTQYDTTPSSLLYSNATGSETINHLYNDKAASTTIPQITEDKDGSIIISSLTKSLLNENQDQAPTFIQSSKSYYSPYGTILKKEDPKTGDILTYDSYDKLGRVTQVTVLPNGQELYKQIYKYKYEIDSKNGTSVITTTSPTGYQEKSIYASGKLIEKQVQTKDQSQFFTTFTAQYNGFGKVTSSTNIIYDKHEEPHPQTSKFYYNKYQQVEAVQNPDGSADIGFTDQYNHRSFSYRYLPTETSAERYSLCFDSRNNNKLTTCESKMVSIQKSLYQPSKKYTGAYIKTGELVYSIILNSEYQYYNQDGQLIDAYSDTYKNYLAFLVRPAFFNGYALKKYSSTSDDVSLSGLAEMIESDCLSGNKCPAISFVKTDIDDNGIVLQTEDYIKGRKLVNHYSDVMQPMGQTTWQKINTQWTPISTTTIEYDQYGNVSNTYINQGGVSDQSERTLISTSDYSALGFTLSSSIFLNNSTDKATYYYDSVGRPVKSIDFLGNEIKTTYNKLWNATDTVTLKDSITTFSYNNFGNILSIEKKDNTGDSSSISYHYNDLMQIPDATTVNYGNNNIRTLTVNTSNYFIPTSTNYTDGLGNLLLSQSMTQNPNGTLKNLTYNHPISRSFSYQYNPDLSTSRVCLGLECSDTKGLSYSSMKYNQSTGALEKHLNYLGSSSLRSYEYGYNQFGQRAISKFITEDGNAEHRYQYDDLDRLSYLSCSGEICPRNIDGDPVTKIAYGYDMLWNRIEQVSETTDNRALNITYKYQNSIPTQVSEIAYSNGRNTSFTYDKLGNVSDISKILPDKSKQKLYLTYDDSENLIKVVKKQPGIISKTISTTNYTYGPDGTQIKESYEDKAGDQQMLFNYYMNGSMIEQQIQNQSRVYISQGSILNKSFSRELTDGFNATGHIDNSGVISGNLVYMPFGLVSNIKEKNQIVTNTINSILNIDQSTQGYNMQHQDLSTGWIFLGNGYRAYDPAARVFLKHDSESPYGAGGINAYSYTLNDPINNSDPTGHSTDADLFALNDYVEGFIASHTVEEFPMWFNMLESLKDLLEVLAPMPEEDIANAVEEVVMKFEAVEFAAVKVEDKWNLIVQNNNINKFVDKLSNDEHFYEAIESTFGSKKGIGFFSEDDVKSLTFKNISAKRDHLSIKTETESDINIHDDIALERTQAETDFSKSNIRTSDYENPNSPLNIYNDKEIEVYRYHGSKEYARIPHGNEFIGPLKHQEGGEYLSKSNGISTSANKDFDGVDDFIAEKAYKKMRQTGTTETTSYVSKIRLKKGQAIDVNKSLGELSIYPEQNEFLAIGEISPEQIIETRPIVVKMIDEESGAITYDGLNKILDDPNF